MNRHNLYRAYIRRATGKEAADNVRIAMQLGEYRLAGRPHFVMVQRGFPNRAIGVGASKREIANTIPAVCAGWLSFSAWARQCQRRAEKMFSYVSKDCDAMAGEMGLGLCEFTGECDLCGHTTRGDARCWEEMGGGEEPEVSRYICEDCLPEAYLEWRAEVAYWNDPQRLVELEAMERGFMEDDNLPDID